MAQISTVTFTGASGHGYSFDAYSFDTVFRPVAAVYAVTRRYLAQDGQHRHVMIYIGQTGNLPARFDDHHKADCFMSHEANCICIHQDSSEESRRAKETDLIRHYNPPCNG